jgi:hypothetical protein
MFQRQYFPISYFPPSYFPKEGQTLISSLIAAGRKKAMARAMLEQVMGKENSRQRKRVIKLMAIRRSILEGRHKEEKAYLQAVKDSNNLALLLTEL